MLQRFKIKKLAKNLIISVLCITSIVSAVISTIPLAKADSSGILGTNAALGSPVLNKDFVIEDWNKWEMEVWGVYLSNFCQPLLDTYETAFKTGSGQGSNGAGYQALCFGSGSDPANNEVIQQLCDDAILYQKTVQKNIYVTYTHLTRTGIGDVEIDKSKADANTLSGEPRQAVFKDLFFQGLKSGAKEDTTCADASTALTKTYSFEGLDSVGNIVSNYTDVALIQDCYIPTFWIKNDKGKFIKILDYNESWDLQMSNLLLSSMRLNDEYAETFKNKFESLMTGEYTIILDAFGNITTTDKLMVIPAAVNPNLTKDKQINLLSSWVFNSYNSTYSDKDIITDLKQISHLGCTLGGGLPAFNNTKKLKNVCLLYYDMDTVMTYAYSKDTSGHINYGQQLLELFEASVESDRNNYQLKIEVAGLDDNSWWWIWDTLDQTFTSHSVITNALANELNEENNNVKPKMLHEIVLTNGNKASLFSTDELIVAPQLKIEEDAEHARMFWNFIYEVYKGKHGDDLKNNLILNLTSTCDTFDEFMEYMEFLWKDFIKVYPEYKNKDWNSQWRDYGDNETINEDANRLCKVYPVSDTMKSVGQIMALQDGKEFDTYCTMIYATYLDWYGIGKSNVLGATDEDKSNFNPEIFDGESDVINYNPEENLPVQSEEEKEREILNLGYLMLSPEDGREYRKQLIYNGFEDFIYEQYNRIVYGGKDSMYSGTASKSNSGFLAIDTFDSNPFTSWFLDIYTDVALVAIMGITLAIIIIGLLKKRKISWYFLNIVVAINVILLVPSSGEIVPYVTSNFIQSMFESKMTYWSISEGITNNNIEAEIPNEESDADNILNIVKTLNVVYTDRSLMLKQDISQKVMQQTGGIYSEIQNIKSARWLLPVVMQQFSGEDSTTDYLYVKLSNVWDDMSNLYWYYDPMDAKSVTKSTATSEQDKSANTSNGIGSLEKDETSYTQLSSYFTDFTPIQYNNRKNNFNYRCYSYTENSNPENQVHLYAYALDYDNHAGLIIPSRDTTIDNYENVDSWSNYINIAVNNPGNLYGPLKTDADNGFESTADTYDRTNRATLNGDFSYLRTTENQVYYFFNVVKDSFSSSTTLGEEVSVEDAAKLGTVIGRLQGTTGKDINGNEVRSSFMHATVTEALSDDSISNRTSDTVCTSYVRDVLDLENLFTNVIPYMYQLQLVTGGFDGKSGVLEDNVMTDLQFYEGQLQSWMYRCNWATKIMENTELTASATVRDANGTSYTVKNPVLPECYPADRPMVFSEAQMNAYGLREADLSLVELKCIEVNKDTCDKWTLLINYAGTDGITKEVLFRQMATDATMIFNTEFSSAGLLNSIYKMYPTSIDLRYLSFDSVMKMLMINVSRNTSYVYGDTMQTLISDSDMITAIVLLLDAFVCAFVVPICRNALLALIFFMGFIAIGQSLFSDGKRKANIACGQLISNLLFMVYTLIYYGCFSIMMALSSTDEVLSVNSVKTDTGNPILVLLIILVFSCAYVWLMYKHIRFCIQNYKDMGSEVFSMVAHSVADRIGEGLANISGGLAAWSEGLSGESGGTGNTHSIKGTGRMNGSTQDVNLKSAGKDTIKLESSDDSGEQFEDIAQQSYQSGEDVDYIETTTSDDIDAEIEAGKDTES